MPFVFKFPDIGEGITEGKILEWYVEVGQKVKSGAKVVKMETDKVVDDIPSPRNGIIVARFGNVGDVIPVHATLVEIEVEDKQGRKTNESTEKEPKKKEIAYGVVGNLEVADESDVLPTSSEGNEERKTVRLQKKVLATPAVRAFARKQGINLKEIPGTGPSGRITKLDVQSFIAQDETVTELSSPITKRNSLAVSSGEKTTIEPLSQLRKTIAKRMLQAKHSAAHMTIFEEIEISALEKIRTAQKQKFKDKGVGLSYLPFIIKAVVQGLKAHPVLNSELDIANDRLIYKKEYHIGIAVDTPSGLVVPVISHADQKSIFELSSIIQDLSVRARERKLSRNELQGGTFTITNFGSIAGIYGTPILNQPEVAILGIGRARKLPVVENDNIVVGNVLPLSLSSDHCIIDGGDATRFLKTVMDYLSNPLDILMM